MNEETIRNVINEELHTQLREISKQLHAISLRQHVMNKNCPQKQMSA